MNPGPGSCVGEIESRGLRGRDPADWRHDGERERKRPEEAALAPRGGRGRASWCSAALGLIAATRGGKEIDPSRLAAVEKGDLARSVVATGKIQPLAKVEIKSKASGIVQQLFVDYGDTVKEGQVLAELDREQLEAAVR